MSAGFANSREAPYRHCVSPLEVTEPSAFPGSGTSSAQSLLPSSGSRVRRMSCAGYNSFSGDRTVLNSRTCQVGVCRPLAVPIVDAVVNPHCNSTQLSLVSQSNASQLPLSILSLSLPTCMLQVAPQVNAHYRLFQRQNQSTQFPILITITRMKIKLKVTEHCWNAPCFGAGTIQSSLLNVASYRGTLKGLWPAMQKLLPNPIDVKWQS